MRFNIFSNNKNMLQKNNYRIIFRVCKDFFYIFLLFIFI